jgi:hypothetical protein
MSNGLVPMEPMGMVDYADYLNTDVMTLHWKLQMMNKQKMEMDNDMEDDNMNLDCIHDSLAKNEFKFKNADDIKRDIKEAVDIMESQDKVSKEYHDLVVEMCNNKSNGNLVQITIPNDDKMKFDDAIYRASQLKEMLDMVDVAVNIGNVDGKPNKMRRWYDEENIRRVVDDWLKNNPGISIVYPHNNDNEIKMEETGMLNDYEREFLEQKLDDLNRIKSEYDKYEWLLDVDPGHDIDAKTQIDITRLKSILRNCLDNCELLKGIGDDAKREIIESAYDIIKHHRDETCKKLKTFLYKNNDEH